MPGSRWLRLGWDDRERGGRGPVLHSRSGGSGRSNDSIDQNAPGLGGIEAGTPSSRFRIRVRSLLALLRSSRVAAQGFTGPFDDIELEVERNRGLLELADLVL